MTDQQLIELAAKSINLTGTWIENLGLQVESTSYYWNPLTDDGQCLRLAVSLGAQGLIEDIILGKQTTIIDGDGNGLWIKESGPDPLINMRRAIVKAAAESVLKNLV